MDFDQQDAVERRAYELWQAAGYPEGRALAHWLQAERELGLPAGTTLPSLDLAAQPSIEGEAPESPPGGFEALDDPSGHP